MSWVGTSKSIWPHVTSLYAHEVVQAAFEFLPAEVASDEAIPSSYDYRMWLRQKLAASRLAQLIPGGLDLLPDFYAALPAWQQPLAMFSRPRDYHDLVKHLINHLDWYVEPQRAAKAYSINPLRGLALLIVPAVFGVTALLSSGAAAVAVMLFGMLLPLSVIMSVQPNRSTNSSIHAEEFYAYIKVAYSDPLDYQADPFIHKVSEMHRQGELSERHTDEESQLIR